MKTFLREVLITAITAVVIYFLIQSTVQTFVVVGTSMQPSFHDGQRLLVNKAVYFFHKPERGDVIVFVPPNSDEGDYIKRIIGLPGDNVEVKGGTVYVNSSKLNEPYIKAPPNYTLKQEKIADNNYFVLGDNRVNSNDSHSGWVVPQQNIVGKAWISIWPPDLWRLVPSYNLQDQLVNLLP